jgi:hypothetical protein
MSEYNIKEKDQSKKKENIIQELHDILDNDAPKNEEMEIIIADKEKKETLERLTDELIQVFNFDNIDNSSDLQKEDLIHQVLKIGGDNYTFEDLRRDILLIKEEDKRNIDLQTIEIEITTGQGDGMELDSTRCSPTLANDVHIGNQKKLAELIMKELENEEECEKDGKKSESALNA